MQIAKKTECLFGSVFVVVACQAVGLGEISEQCENLASLESASLYSLAAVVQATDPCTYQFLSEAF